MIKSVKDIMNHEYLMTNGLGGYSFCTLDQVNCRKYHGLYTVSYNPPIERVHLISKLEEQLTIADKTHLLSYENVTGNDNTHSNLIKFGHEGVIEQHFICEDVSVKRTLAMQYGTNLLAVRYEIQSPKEIEMTFTPWFNFRDHHQVITPELSAYTSEYDSSKGILKVTDAQHDVYIQAEGTFNEKRILSGVSHYPIETQRGYPDAEAHVILGTYHYKVQAGTQIIDFVIHTSDTFLPAEAIFSARKARYEKLMALADAKDIYLKQLVQAADDFIVYRKTTGKMTILAGYPWFSDWGRDTMISIPGLTLETGRAEEAFQMIEGFLSMSHQGIIPNNFPDEGQAPMYNTSDGTLWLFNAVYAYYQKTKDLEGIKTLYPKLMAIINHHVQGTINEIYMDSDGLLSSGNEDTQLTWMDVKVNGWVVTPRHGKAVEINALWYNALAIMSEFTHLLDVPMHALEVNFQSLLPQIKKSFHKAFWNEKDQNLFDLVIDGKPVDIPRPNMIFAVSMPFSVLEASYHKPIVDYVAQHFKIPYGLLTLKREDENFNAHYEGDLLARDGAYHRGTAWGWLIGPYLEAHFKTYNDTSYIKESLLALFEHLDEGIHGSISEIFEGAAPHAQRGCSAQAWSVAEAIRLWKLIH